MIHEKANRLPTSFILMLYFFSGALALVYEVVWARMMMHVFGSTAIAVGTVLAAFMSGMAIGSWFIGKIADKSPDCLRLYAWLEVGIAVTALISHLLLDRIIPVHAAVHNLVGSYEAVFVLVRFMLAFLLVLAPTILMGATLPVLTRFWVNRGTMVGINLSTLYAVNTFGAVTGVVITGFLLIGRYGIHIPVYLAVFGNLLIGLAAWMVSRRSADLPAVTEPGTAEPVDDLVPESGGLDLRTYHIVLFGLGISGLTSFAYEIYWTRSLVFIMGNSTYALTTMLSSFLTGIALGGYLIRFLLGRIRDRVAIFGWIQVFLGVFSALALPFLFSVADPQSMSQYFAKYSSQAVLLVFSGFGLAFLVMLVPAILIGATLPLVGQIAVRDEQKTGALVGKTYAINTCGNVLGALLPGFFLLNWLGIQKGIVAMATLNICLGFVILVLRLTRPSYHRIWRVVLPVVLICSAVVLSRAPIGFQFPSDGERDYFQTLFYREGPSATTKVYVNPRTNEKHMSVDGIVIGGTGFAEFKQHLLAHLPKLLLKDTSTELSVGLGSGILAGESIRHPGVREITSVEIEPSVVEGAGFFRMENHGILEDPRLINVTDDIGNFLRTTTGTYQVITADEKTADEYASNGFSYSLDYYALLRDHLAPGGLVAQWVPTTLPPSLYQMILKTFTESFEFVQLWYFLPAHTRGPFNTILIGSMQEIHVDYDHISQQFEENPESYRSLVPYGLTSAEAVIPHFVASESVIRNAVKTADVNSLEHPLYEFFYPWDFASEREKQYIANHDFITRIKNEAFPDFLASFQKDMQDTMSLRQSIAAEFRFLDGFRSFQTGISLPELYRVFDDALGVAPWNDSLRAQVYSLYVHVASSSRNPSERVRLMQRADALYAKKQTD
jgi:spermidine synthase